MKKILILMTLAVCFLSAGCASYSKGSGGTRDNPTKLKASPCAGCFGEDEKRKLNIKDNHA